MGTKRFYFGGACDMRKTLSVAWQGSIAHHKAPLGTYEIKNGAFPNKLRLFPWFMKTGVTLHFLFTSSRSNTVGPRSLFFLEDLAGNIVSGRREGLTDP